ncbi:MAG: acetylglutamate kinase, partial [Synechococcus sp.]|nr:acetylglutamate kinase [Synechococcus sp.]
MSLEPAMTTPDVLRVEVLSEALPYIQRFRGRRVV